MKINMAVTEPPRFSTLADGSGSARAAPAASSSRPSIDYMQQAYDEARAGRPAATPVHEHPHPVGGRSTRSRRRARTPSRSSPSTSRTRSPRGPGTSAATRSPTTCSRSSPSYAPNIPGSVLARQVLAPPGSRSPVRPDRRPHLPRRAGAGAGVRPAPGAGIELVRRADPRALPLRLRGMARRLRDGRARTQRRPRSHRPFPGWSQLIRIVPS